MRLPDDGEPTRVWKRARKTRTAIFSYLGTRATRV